MGGGGSSLFPAAVRFRPDASVERIPEIVFGKFLATHEADPSAFYGRLHSFQIGNVKLLLKEENILPADPTYYIRIGGMPTI